jgi:predicted enzyme related to lactoylglutathione lyase
MARINGIGGIFFKSRDPKALAAWYRDVLGLAVENWGGAMFPREAAGPYQVWTPFAADSTHFAPSGREFMVNLAVDDLDGVLARVEAKGVAVLGRDDGEYGRFAWILDPDGTKIELWQPNTES